MRLLIGIGDLHGNWKGLERILEVLDEHLGILGTRGSLDRDVTIVFTGDYIDRRPGALQIIDRLKRLGRGPGQVVALFGNHELMALEYLDEARRAVADGLREPIRSYVRGTDHGVNGAAAFIREFGATDRAAMASYVRRMGRGEDVGSWLRALSFSYRGRIGGRTILFTHADIPVRLRHPEELEHHVRRMEVRAQRRSSRAGGTAAKWGHPALSGDDSLFWCRSFQRLRKRGLSDARRVCRALDVDYIVTGHTPHREIRSYGDRIFDIDCGMGFGDPPAAIVFTKREVFGLDAKGRQRVFVAEEE